MAFEGISFRKYNELVVRMTRLGVNERDITESFIRSSVPGGQNVNKVSSCVQLVHSPTRILIKCQKERSQSMNRYLARILLLDLIEQRMIAEKQKKISEKEKIKRQNRKRPHRLQELILENKRQKKQKKFARKKILTHHMDHYL